jgi:bile acid:Na+ symporter, BASS family
VDSAFFTAALLPTALAAIMISLGLTLTLADFRRVLIVRRGVVIGLANLLLLSPLLAGVIADLYGLSATLAVGLVLLGASPGGTIANLLTHLARGDTALSVTMTAVSSVVAVITLPLYLSLAVDVFAAQGLSIHVSMWGVVLRVFLISIVPLSVGMRIRARHPDTADRVAAKTRIVALVSFALVVIGALASQWHTVTGSFGDVAPAALTLNLMAMTISFGIARLARLNNFQATAIAMELGVHNATLAIAVGAALDIQLAIPAAVYSVFQFLTAATFAGFMSRRIAATAGG